jgi:hypothetical protein
LWRALALVLTTGHADNERVPDLANGLALLGNALTTGDPSRITSALTSVAIRRVTVRTQITPGFSYEPSYDANGTPQAAPGASILNPLALLKPEITIEPVVGSPIVVAPYGSPTTNYLPHLAGAVAGTVALIAFWRGALALAKGAALVGGGLLLAGVVKNRIGWTP